MAKYSINLLQAGLLPKKPLWTLNRVIGLWAFSLSVMVLTSVLLTMQQSQLMRQQKQLLTAETTNKNKLAALEQRIAQNRKDTRLVEQLKTLKFMLDNKQSLQLQLTDPKQTYSAGFSAAMSELAQLHDKNISLERVNIGYGNMTFAGVARSPDAVPIWLSKFESSTFLSGKSFVNFTLSENEQHITEFVVSSVASKEAN
jgi:hypothetical protein